MLAKKSENAVKKQKVVVLEVKFEVNINGVLAEINWPWRSWHCCDWKDSKNVGSRTPWRQLLNINEANGCDENDEDVPGKETAAKIFTLKKLSEIFHDIENAKDIMLNDVWWHLLHIIRYMIRMRTVQTTLDKLFLQRNKTLYFSVFLSFKL